MKEIVTIQISKFLTNELAEKLDRAQWKGLQINRSRQYVFDELTSGNNCFDVVAAAPNGIIIGRIHCVRNETDPRLWYYGDLFVLPEYRRMGVASQMIRAATAHLSETGAAALQCYVEPDNLPARELQLSLGFSEQPFRTFNGFTNDGEIMYEVKIPNALTVIPATADEAYFVGILFAQNRAALNFDDNISLSEWRELLSYDDADEKYLLVCKGAVPLAYMKLNGLVGTGEAWISMLFVAKVFQRQGIGSFAIKYAEEYVRGKGFTSLAVQTEKDNLAAQSCYLKCGYQVFESGEKVKFRKKLR